MKTLKYASTSKMKRNIGLRKFDINTDLYLFHRVHSDSLSMQYYGMSEFKELEESKKLIFNYIESECNNKSIHRVIYNIDSGEYIGEIGLFNISERHHRAETYCILLPEARKKGVLQYVSPLFYGEVFAKLHLNRVQALVDSRNINAAKSFIGVGFNYEGRLTEYEYCNGEYIDIDLFSLTKRDFIELYGK